MATLKCETHYPLLNITRTSTSTSYTFTADRNDFFYYDADVYSDVTAIYFEAVMRAGASGDTAYMVLSTTAPADVTGSGISTTSTSASNVIVRSGDIKANLTDNTLYRARWKTDNGAGGAPAGTAAFDACRVIVVQQGAVTKTETVIELGEDNNVASTDYSSPPGDYAIWEYEADRYDGTVTAYYAADMRGTGAGAQVKSRLYDITAAAAVASSEVTTTSGVADRQISAAITLVDTHEYRIDVGGDTTSQDVLAGMVIIRQTGTPTKTDKYLTVLNGISSGTGSTYAYQNRKIDWDGSNWDGDSETAKFEATLNSSGGNTAYYQLYNDTDAGELGVVTTTSTSYVRARDDTVTMPTDDDNVLNSARKVDTAGTVKASRAFLIMQMDWSVPSTRRVFNVT